MVHILVILGDLWLTVRLLQWGKLFRLDELPEFNRSVLEVMRQPLEDRIISISRAKYSTEYPASFMLVASMNPCPCGYYGHPKKKCVCNEYQRIHCNAQMTPSLLHKYAEPNAAGLEKLHDAMERMNMSARAYDRILWCRPHYRRPRPQQPRQFLTEKIMK